MNSQRIHQHQGAKPYLNSTYGFNSFGTHFTEKLSKSKNTKIVFLIYFKNKLIKRLFATTSMKKEKTFHYATVLSLWKKSQLIKCLARFFFSVDLWYPDDHDKHDLHKGNKS